MRINYDISVLGRGYYNKTSRTGVFRVIENLANELLRKKIDMKFVADASILSYFESLDYLNSKNVNQELLLKHNFGDVNYTFFKNIHLVNTSKRNKFTKLFLQGLNKGLSINKSYISNNFQNKEIYHSTFYPLPRIIRKNTNIIKIQTIYDLIPITNPEYFRKNEIGAIKKVLKSIDKDCWILCISNFTKRMLIEHLPHLDDKKIIVTYLAASSNFKYIEDSNVIEKIKNKYNIPDDKYFLSLCTFEPRKNIISTIKAFSEYVQGTNNANVYLVLVGTKGWKFNEIFSEIVKSKNVKDRIIVTGYVEDKDLSALYSGALAFIFPSYLEGFGLPPLEAMKCGTPTISSNTSSLPEVVADSGILVEPHDIDSIVNAMLLISSNEGYRKELSEKSLSRSSLFSWDECAKQTINTYKLAYSNCG